MLFFQVLQLTCCYHVRYIWSLLLFLCSPCRHSSKNILGPQISVLIVKKSFCTTIYSFHVQDRRLLFSSKYLVARRTSRLTISLIKTLLPRSTNSISPPSLSVIYCCFSQIWGKCCFFGCFCHCKKLCDTNNPPTHDPKIFREIQFWWRATNYYLQIFQVLCFMSIQRPVWCLFTLIVYLISRGNGLLVRETGNMVFLSRITPSKTCKTIIL